MTVLTLIKLLIICAVFCCTVAEEKTIEQVLDNGCVLTRYKANVTNLSTYWWDMPLPHLNCSGVGKSRFEVDGVIADTRSITLSYNNLIEFHVDDLEKFVNLTKLEIKSNKLQRVLPSQNNLRLHKVIYLSFAQNQLDKVPNEALKSFPSLTALVLNNNNIRTIFYDDFKYNLKLSHLMLGYNPIETLNDTWMTSLELRSLNLANCSLTKIPKKIAEIQGIFYLDLSGNEFDILPANSFANCSKLFMLDIVSNGIKRIDEKAFQGAIKLSYIDISDNLLETLPARIFDGISKENLQIDLFANPINCNCSMAPFVQRMNQIKEYDEPTEVRFACQNPLRLHGKKSRELKIEDYACKPDDKLWTGDCPVVPTSPTSPTSPTTTSPSQTAQKTTFKTPTICPSKCTCWDENRNMYYPPPGQTSKQYKGWSSWRANNFPRVDCIDTGYTSLPQAIPSNVATLVLGGNRLSLFYIAGLSKFKNLKTLILNGNKIRSIVSDNTIKLPNLSVLLLHYNNISVIDKKQLISFPNLSTISLFNNALKTIPQDLFAFNRKLTRLYLGPNPVKNFQEDFMKTLSLRSLSLRNMSLTKIPKSLRELVNLTYADLSDNQITTIPNSTFSNNKNLYRLALDNNRISKVEANAFKGASALAFLDLTENLLTTLPGSVFSNVNPERLTVELWANRFVCDCKLKPFKQWVEKRVASDPMTEIRFQCDQPLLMHDRRSEQLSADEFRCSAHDAPFVHDIVCTEPNIAGKIALSVILTFIFTILIGAIVWRCAFRRRYGELLSYAKQRENYEDMEELH